MHYWIRCRSNYLGLNSWVSQTVIDYWGDWNLAAYRSLRLWLWSRFFLFFVCRFAMPMACHFRNCKALLVTSLTHADSVVASTWPLHLALALTRCKRLRGVVDCIRRLLRR